MRKIFNNKLGSFVVLSSVLLCSAMVVQGQDREARVISAKAGGVNSVSGDVNYQRKGETDWQKVTAKENLDSGDVVKTGPGSFVEVLLNPGSYIRAAENTEFELTDASLDNLRLRLIKGSAVIEATIFDKDKELMSIDAPKTKVSIVRSGLYRINVLPSGMTEVVVRKGRALVGDGALLVKGDNKKTLAGGDAPLEIVKFDKKEKDALDQWSKERANVIAEANRKLSYRNVNSLLASLNFDSMFSASRGFRSTGVWMYSSSRGCYTFLPFYSNWSSPYGGFYSNSLYWPGNPSCGSCPNRSSGGNYSQPVIVNSGSNGGGAVGNPNPMPNPSGGGGAPSGPSQAPSPVVDRPAPTPSIIERKMNPGDFDGPSRGSRIERNRDQ